MAGIYIHIPFCKQACTYCNFHFSTSLQHKDNLIQSLIQEINEPNSFIDYEESIDTIYFGGGTPSLLSKDQLEKSWMPYQLILKLTTEQKLHLKQTPMILTRKAWITGKYRN